MFMQLLPLNGEGDGDGDAIPWIPADTSVLRAARSLYVNRRLADVVATRIARASTLLEMYLAGRRCVHVGLYLVEMVDGEIKLTKATVRSGIQLRLWQPDGQMDLFALETDDRPQTSAAG